jgi:hypothetical protein
MADNPAERAARANIPASALRDMTAVAYDARADVRAFGFATGGPAPAIPEDRSKQVSRPNSPGDGSGWRSDVPFGHNNQHPTPGVAAADRIADAFAARDRAELKQKLAPQASTTLEQQLLVITKQLEVLMLLRDRAEQQAAAKGSVRPARKEK